ncbi:MULTISPECIES: hypothetical protein [unclassified Saccharopolyspora]|uniref:hypothetical protein n=1 Tax=unclassified Saccharopolyspora TaxID=2646250 RepID=UPI001CD2298E|nr:MULTISPECIES: hypothetical protein [unclassified Saccharopolyspora]MCA1191476.1 hypothetical protein [Saccharopolyspora sp. 6V]MCA1226850.1 hypothetical protein [Saccharopolyspora sp. 6M]
MEQVGGRAGQADSAENPGKTSSGAGASAVGIVTSLAPRTDVIGAKREIGTRREPRPRSFVGIRGCAIRCCRGKCCVRDRTHIGAAVHLCDRDMPQNGEEKTLVAAHIFTQGDDANHAYIPLL